jgi:hypothetical protein
VLGLVVTLGSYRAAFATAGLCALGGLILLPRLASRTPAGS